VHTKPRDEPRELHFDAMMPHGLNATTNTASVAGGNTARHGRHTGQVLPHHLLDVIFVHPRDFVKVLHSEFPEEACCARSTHTETTHRQTQDGGHLPRVSPRCSCTGCCGEMRFNQSATKFMASSATSGHFPSLLRNSSVLFASRTKAKSMRSCSALRRDVNAAKSRPF
jgi:hypothetical protein